jgi:hypothetical protein
MEGYRCPNKGCTTELHFELISWIGIRVYQEKETEFGKKKVYNAFCPTCDEDMQVDEKNQKLTLTE